MPEGKVHWKNSKGNLPRGYLERVNPVAFLFIKIAIKHEAGQTPKSRTSGRNKNSDVTRDQACDYIFSQLEERWNDTEKAQKFANRVLRDLWNSAELSFHLNDLNYFCQVLVSVGLFNNWYEFEHTFYHNEFFKIGREKYCNKNFSEFTPTEVECVNELANLAFYSLLGSKILLKNDGNQHLIKMFKQFSIDSDKDRFHHSNIDFEDYRHLVEPYIKILKARNHIWGFGKHFSIGLNPSNMDTSLGVLYHMNIRFSGKAENLWYVLTCEDALITVLNMDELIENFNNRNFEYIESNTPLFKDY